MKRKGLDVVTETVDLSLIKLSEALELLERDEEPAMLGALGDAAVKRFEVAFEYTWKLMQVAVAHEGGEAFGPRQAIAESVGMGWIDDPEFWARALDARNGSVHDYFGITRDAYVKIMRQFVTECRELIKRIGASGNAVIRNP